MQLWLAISIGIYFASQQASTSTKGVIMVKILRQQSLQDNNTLGSSNSMPIETPKTHGSSRKRFLGRSILAMPIVVSLGMFSTTSSADMIFISDFKTGGIQAPQAYRDGWGTGLQNPKNAHLRDDLKVQSKITRGGNYAARLQIDRSKNYSSINGNGRDKPRVNLSKWPNSYRFNYNTDYWLGWSVYLPSDWVDDLARNSDILMQVHSGTGSGAPMIGLAVIGGNWVFTNRKDENNIKFNRNTTTIRHFFKTPTKNDKGKWTDWVMRFRLCYKRGCDGLIEIWKDGEKVTTLTGPNAYKETDKKPLLSFNLYKPNWKTEATKTSRRTVYLDEIRVANANSKFSVVSVSREKPPQSPTGFVLINETP